MASGARLLLLVVIGLGSGAFGRAQETEPSPESAEEAEPEQPPARPPTRAPDDETPPVSPIHGKVGLVFETADGSYRNHTWFRGQFRYYYPFDRDPTTPEDVSSRVDESSFVIRRARLKVDGNVFMRWLRYYFEYDFVNTRILDLRMTVARYDAFNVRVGQWKVNYNRERVDSSGRQQFVERSIVNREFTLDRQPGVMVGGQLFSGRRAESRYYFGVFNGAGAGAANDDSSMMVVGRYQWHVFGRELGYAQSDIGRSEKPLATVAVGASRNRSRYTRFSGGGGGQLDGFEPGEPGQYRLRQLVEEVAFKYRGFSFQHEAHWKEVHDRLSEKATRLAGVYAQAGYFLDGLSDRLPSPLEVAVRYAWVDPDRATASDERDEWTVAVNWFFMGHDNKLTFDASRLTLFDVSGARVTERRVRAQWDISF